MKKRFVSIVDVIIILMSFPISFADSNIYQGLDCQAYEEYSLVVKELHIQDQKLTYIMDSIIDGTVYITAVFNDGSVLVVSEEEYAYSRIEDGCMHIKSENGGQVQEKIIDHDAILHGNIENDLVVSETLSLPIEPRSEEYSERHYTDIGYFEYYFRQTLTVRLVKLTVPTGDLGDDLIWHQNSTSASSPEQDFEQTADDFLYYLNSCNTLVNTDFIPDLFDKAGLYYPTLSISTKEDIIEIYRTYLEEGFEEGTSTLISATITAIVDYLAGGFASNTALFVNAGFGLASHIVVHSNYGLMKDEYDTFVTQ